MVIRTTKYEIAPPIWHLEPHEKFRDDEGKCIEIETRGIRSVQGSYFLASDVAEALQMPSLVSTIQDTRWGYTHEHRKAFIRGDSENLKITPNGTSNDIPYTHKCGNSNILYITYPGMIKVIYSSRSKQAKRFHEWANKILFAAQMGSDDQRIEAAATVLNRPVSVVRDVLNCHSGPISGTYLVRLGKVSALRAAFHISDTFLSTTDQEEDLELYKYGNTGDLVRRIRELDQTYRKVAGVEVQLAVFCIIHAPNLFRAETEIRSLCVGFGKHLHSTPTPPETETTAPKINGHTELVILSRKELAGLKDVYELLGTKYSQSTAEVQIQISARVQEIVALRAEKIAADNAAAAETKQLKTELVFTKELHALETSGLKKQMEMEQQLHVAVTEKFQAQNKLLTYMLEGTNPRG